MSFPNYKYFRIQKTTEGPDTWWDVVNKRSGQPIGMVYWLDVWKQYIFESCEGTIWSADCLKDVRDAIAHITKEEKP